MKTKAQKKEEAATRKEAWNALTFPGQGDAIRQKGLIWPSKKEAARWLSRCDRTKYPIGFELMANYIEKCNEWEKSRPIGGKLVALIRWMKLTDQTLIHHTYLSLRKHEIDHLVKTTKFPIGFFENF